jgi:uncharacterized protein YkwD
MRPIPSIVLRSSLSLTVFWVSIATSHAQEAKTKQSNGDAAGRDKAVAILNELVTAHNKVRAEHKLPPLKANARLTKAAIGHARDMAEHDKLTHEGSDGSKSFERIKRAGYVYKDCGENVASGQETVAEVMRTWMESPPHRENILADFTEMGGGVAQGKDGTNYWCVDLGRPIPAVDPAKSPRALIEALNGARAEARKKPLKADAQLAGTAAEFARLAAERRSLEVKNADGKSPFDVLKAKGYRAQRFAMILYSGEGDPAKVVAGWLERKEDRDTLLSGFDRAGVGVATDSDGIPYWILLLAQT